MVFISIKINRSPLRNLIITCLILFITLALFPLDLTAQMKLAWDPPTSPDVDGYRVYYGIASRTYGAPINVGNVTTYTLNGLSSGVIYYIAVTAYDTANNESDYSNEVSGQITETVSPPTVLGGPTSGTTGTSNTYTAGGSISNLGHSVEYQFDWKGDGTDVSPWGSATQSKAWAAVGTYNVRARARCVTHTNVVSSWIGPIFLNITQATLSYTVTTNPSGLQITVDGANYIAPQIFNWAAGATHNLSVNSPQNGTSGTRYVHSSWSDGGAQAHTITVPTSSTTYTANFRTQYSLTTSANPTAGGAVTPSGTSWYDSNQSVSCSATANVGYSFLNWSGDLSGSSPSTSVTMIGPKSGTANFSQTQTQYEFYIGGDGHSWMSISPNKSLFNPGDVVVLTAYVDPGYRFDHWSGDATGTQNPLNFSLGTKTTLQFTSNTVPITQE